jgi:hypothetical protein
MMGAGLRMICKAYGGIRFRGADGKVTEYIWDYKNDRPVNVEDLKALAKKDKEDRKAERIERKKRIEEYMKKQTTLDLE